MTIYLDYQATTPLAPEAAAAMRPWLEEKFANPHSSHKLGREAAAAVEVAREQVLAALDGSRSRSRSAGADQPADAAVEPGALYFTGSATEAINWAIKGAALGLPRERRRIVTIATEHAAVLDTVEWLRGQGYAVEVLPVRGDGLVDPELLDERITPDTGLVAAMLVNNEIGIVHPVLQIGELARSRGALFLCDAVQGFGRAFMPLRACDLVAISAHKVYGPKGVGALWVRDRVKLEPLLHGGGQEGGGRSGTLSPALCAGFGEAARLLTERWNDDMLRVDRLWSLALRALPGWTVNGSVDHRYHGNLNIRRDGIDAARLISEVREVAFSAGSACASGSGRPSHVLAAIGLSEREARSSIRLGFGRYTSEDELRTALGLIDEAAERQL